ncbi:MAG: glycosyltransferase family 4 protein [Deltaproteobacteria bacterium]|nr:glycosyltransferase family 4 protein [Deltaproteobacteria bacterium]
MTKTIHVTPAAISLNVLLKDRLMIMAGQGFEVAGFSTPDNHSAEFEKSGFRFIASRHLTREFSVIKDFLFFMECYRVFRRERPEIVNTYGPKPGLYARIAARLAGVPVVVHTSWGLFFSENSNWLRKWTVILMERFAALFCDYIFSVNKDDLALMRAHRFKDESRIGYLGNGTDIKIKFNPANYSSQRPDNAKRCVIGSVGRLTRAKGFAEFFDAAREIKKKHPHVVFSIVGIADKSRGNGIPAALIAELTGAGIIDLKSPKPHEEMPLFYNSIDIMVLPSHREGFPRSLVEAAAMGRPVITTDTRGCREVVEDGYNGFLVPVGDSNALAAAMEKLVTDEKLRKEMGIDSRKKAEREFDENVLVERVTVVYNNLLGNQRGRACRIGV